MARAFTITRRGSFIGERTCDLIEHTSPFGIETILHIDSDSGELILAEVIDGEWTDIDLAYAEQEFADILEEARRHQ